MYFFRDDTSPDGLLSENIDLEGHLSLQHETPYSDYSAFVHPLRVSPDGSIVLLGSGLIFDAVNLTLSNTLSNDISDGDWLGGSLYTIRPLNGNSEIQRWASNYAIANTFQLGGTPLRFLANGQELVAITMVNHFPTFTVLGSGLNILYQTPPPVLPVSAASRRVHGATAFSVPLPIFGDAGIECRNGGGTGDYDVVFTFAKAVTVTDASLAFGAGQARGFSVNGPVVTVNLTGVQNLQTILVRLGQVNDGTNVSGAFVPMRVIIGDVNANAQVNSADVTQAKAQSGSAVTQSNFRADVVSNGLINSSDIVLVKSKSGTGLAAPRPAVPAVKRATLRARKN
jgi:hypothetical protein